MALGMRRKHFPTVFFTAVEYQTLIHGEQGRSHVSSCLWSLTAVSVSGLIGSRSEFETCVSGFAGACGTKAASVQLCT